MSPTGDLLVTQFFLGKCPLELAQGPSCVALAWHKARGSTPFGVTKLSSLSPPSLPACLLACLLVLPPLCFFAPLLLLCCPKNLCFEGPPRERNLIHKSTLDILPKPSEADFCDLKPTCCRKAPLNFEQTLPRTTPSLMNFPFIFLSSLPPSPI